MSTLVHVHDPCSWAGTRLSVWNLGTRRGEVSQSSRVTQVTKQEGDTDRDREKEVERNSYNHEWTIRETSHNVEVERRRLLVCCCGGGKP